MAGELDRFLFQTKSPDRGTGLKFRQYLSCSQWDITSRTKNIGHGVSGGQIISCAV